MGMATRTGGKARGSAISVSGRREWRTGRTHSSAAAAAASTMRVRTPALLLAAATLACFILCAAGSCDQNQMLYGCKIYGNQCSCGHGCSSEFIYRSRQECLGALRERSSNICYRMPCLRGICIQTIQDPGFSCKCEGTGFYGRRCEKACPTIPMRGLVFPHECVVI